MENRFISYSSADEFIIKDKESDRFLDKNKIVAYLNEQNQQIAELESKLAESVEIINEWMRLNIEKSAEIHRLKQLITEEKNRNKKLNHEAQKYYEDAYCNGFQNKKAIAELESLKNYLPNIALDIPDMVSYGKLLNKINQQISNLKGETQ